LRENILRVFQGALIKVRFAAGARLDVGSWKTGKQMQNLSKIRKIIRETVIRTKHTRMSSNTVKTKFTGEAENFEVPW
jgi:hypothetical protein